MFVVYLLVNHLAVRKLVAVRRVRYLNGCLQLMLNRGLKLEEFYCVSRSCSRTSPRNPRPRRRSGLPRSHTPRIPSTAHEASEKASRAAGRHFRRPRHLKSITRDSAIKSVPRQTVFVVYVV